MAPRDQYDGYRAQAHWVNGKASIFTRRGYDWTHTFRSIAEALAGLGAHELVMDGEIVVLDERGGADFHQQQEHLAKGRTDRLVYVAFDLLYEDGVDLRGASLIDRKTRLAEVLSRTARRVSM